MNPFAGNRKVHRVVWNPEAANLRAYCNRKWKFGQLYDSGITCKRCKAEVRKLNRKAVRG
jgi:hypothetical protein